MDLNVKHMIKNQLVRRDIADKKVLEAIEKVPRHLFVGKVQRPFAYGDNPLPIGHGQTILSQGIIHSGVKYSLDALLNKAKYPTSPHRS